MSNCLTQDFLRNGGSINDLKEKYHIIVKQHGRYPQLFHFHYSQYDSPMHEPIVQECRSLILDSSDNWKVVGRCMKKFFNDGDPLAAKLDWSKIRVQEKLDGSLIMLFHYNNHWNVSSSGVPDASGQVQGFDFNFSELFWKVFDELELNIASFSPNFTYMFELQTMYNRVIVRHKTNKLGLIAMIHTERGYEVDPKDIYFPYKAPEYPLQTHKDVLEAILKLDPLESEGYVLVNYNEDGSASRVKCKNPDYLALAHIKEGLSPKSILNVVRTNESREFLLSFPEWIPVFNDVINKYESLVKELENIYENIQHIETQKEFALEAKKSRCSSALFSKRAYGTSIRQYLAECRLDNLYWVLYK